MGNIQNLTAGGGAVDQFITFPGTNLDFVLTGFGATTTNSTACDTVIGHSCIWAAGSPFDLTNTAGGVSIGVIMLGTIVDGGVISDWNALFTTQLLSSTALDVQNTILGAGSISDTYSAVLTVSPPASSSPEPGTLSMLLLGSVGLIGMGRKRFAKR